MNRANGVANGAGHHFLRRSVQTGQLQEGLHAIAEEVDALVEQVNADRHVSAYRVSLKKIAGI